MAHNLRQLDFKKEKVPTKSICEDHVPKVLFFLCVCGFTDTIQIKNLKKSPHVWLKDYYVLEFSIQ